MSGRRVRITPPEGGDTELMADAELLSWRRGGDPVRVDAAMIELYRRHRGAARAVARRLVSSDADADDVVEDAFERVGRAIGNGRGPTEDFRSYLMVAVRSSAATLYRDSARSQPTDVLEAVEVEDPSSLLMADLERSAAGRAFESLPERWRTVLWLVDVEGRPASEVAVMLGIGANAVAALTYRAREGLRQAFVVAQAAQVDDLLDADCASVREVIGAYVRGRASQRDQTRVERHVQHCDRCAAVLAEARDVNSTIMLSVAGLVVPAGAVAALRAVPTWLTSGGGAGRVAAGAAGAAGAGAAGAGAAASTGGKLAVLGRHPVAAGAAAVTAVAAAVAAVVALTAGPDDVSAGSRVADPTSVVATPRRSEPSAPGAAVEGVDAFHLPSPAAAERPAPLRASSPDALPSTTTTAPASSVPDPQPVAQRSSATSPQPPDAPGVAPISVVATQVGPSDSAGRFPVLVRLGRQIVAGERASLRWGLGSGGSGGTDGGGVELAPGTSSTMLSVGPFTGDPVALSITVDVARDGAPPASSGPASSGPASSTASIALDVATAPMRTLWSGFGSYQLAATGNSVLTCDGAPGCAEAADGRGSALSNDRWNMVWSHPDGVGTGSSSAQLDLPAGSTVRAALLVWGGSAPSGAGPDELQSVRLTAGGVTSTVRAQELLTGSAGAYQGVAEVTSLVRSGGEIGVSGVAARTGAGSWGGWSLVVVVERRGIAERSVTVTTGLSDGPVDQRLFGGAGRVEQVLALQWEGDAGLGPDSMSLTGSGAGPVALSDALNPADDVANSSVSIGGVRPAGVDANTFGVDVDLFDTSAGPLRTDPRLVATSTSDRRFVGVLGWAVAPA